MPTLEGYFDDNVLDKDFSVAIELVRRQYSGNTKAVIRDWVVTNDPTQDSTKATQETCGFRWKIEQLHRQGK